MCASSMKQSFKDALTQQRTAQAGAPQYRTLLADGSVATTGGSNRSAQVAGAKAQAGRWLMGAAPMVKKSSFQSLLGGGG